MPTIFTNNNQWGNAIHWVDYEKRRVTGHSPTLPQAGDFLDYEMQSGRIGRFKFETVHVCADPRDMFFADMSDVGYVDELTESNDAS